MINCKIISVRNTENERYNKRNKIIDSFMETFKNESIKLEISEAITPNDWNLNSDKVQYLNYTFNKDERLGHSHGITNYLSHFKIWNNKEPTLILEDDVIYDIDLFNRLLKLIEKFNNINIDNKLLYLQSSCPWRENFPDKQYQSLINFSDDFWVIPNTEFDVSGTAAYYINTNDDLLNILTHKIGATDGILHNLMKNTSLIYFLPKDFNNWFKLDKNLQ